MITQAELKKKVSYCSETGVFTRLKAYRDKGIGSVIGGDSGHGYLEIRFDRLYMCHRLAWLYVYGEWPEKTIDHINGNGKDNRILNLRDVSQKDNSRNCKMSRNNNSGASGVSIRKDTGRWRARIMIDYKEKSIGCFSCITAAILARDAAIIKYGFNPNHGKTENERINACN